MNPWRSSLMLLLVLLSLLLTGCVSTFLIHDTTVSEVTVVLEDYTGTHGYKIAYRDDELGTFRLSLGNVFIPERSETTKTKQLTQQLPPEDTNQPYTAYEETTWRTVKTPGRYVEAAARISLTQLDDNVRVVVEPNDAAGGALDDLRDYLRRIGYVVEKK